MRGIVSGARAAYHNKYPRHDHQPLTAFLIITFLLTILSNQQLENRYHLDHSEAARRFAAAASQSPPSPFLQQNFCLTMLIRPSALTAMLFAARTIHTQAVGCHPAWTSSGAVVAGSLRSNSVTTTAEKMENCNAGTSGCANGKKTIKTSTATYTNYACVNNAYSAFCGSAGYEPGTANGSLAWTATGTCDVSASFQRRRFSSMSLKTAAIFFETAFSSLDRFAHPPCSFPPYPLLPRRILWY